MFLLGSTLLSRAAGDVAGQVVGQNATLRGAEWQQGYTLVVTSNTDISSANLARDFVTEQGGRIAILLPPHIMLGWVPPELAGKLIGKHGIELISYETVGLTALRYKDEGTVAAASFFNSVICGEIAEEAERAETTQGDPLADDVKGPPTLDYQSYQENLGQIGLAASSANSDSLTGAVAVSLFFIESDGGVDANTYTWTSTDQQNTVNRSLSELSWWSSQAQTFNQNLSFSVFSYSATGSVTQQSFEPIFHSSSDDGLWINEIMSHLGFTSGDAIARVTAFNTYMRHYAGTNWAYSAFIGYNPAPAPATFTDQRFAYTIALGGPYTQLLFRNDGWGEANFGLVLTHETGHIFWACDEYYQPGYGGCQGCDVCASFGPRPNAANGNCAACNPNAVDCMMRGNSHALCSFTPAQIGWSSGVPPPPKADTATKVTSSDFRANWNPASDSTGYRLDVSTSSTFSSFVSGYQDLDVGNVLSCSVSRLRPVTTYYYRVRAYNANGTSSNSELTSVVTASSKVKTTAHQKKEAGAGGRRQERE
jgi:hypothetical protein